MEKVKITVIKRFSPEDVFGKSMYEPNGEMIPPCDILKDGQEFLMDNENLFKPEGFCEWAWKDILPFITTLACGGNFKWYPKGVAYGACSDGMRPVCFKLEVIE